jgi:hypothetical protein
MTRLSFLLLLAATAAVPARGQEEAPAPIQDNSFLIEEAYNQEAGVVQHISTYVHDVSSGDWAYSFTQEWPLRSQRHQFSFTLPAASLVENESRHAGIGDVALTYRLQLRGDGGPGVAIAPRASLLVPSGSSNRGLGAGNASLQFALPVSATLGSRLVTHWNAAYAWTPSAHGENDARASLSSWSAGASVVWLARPRFNVLVESVWARTASVSGPSASSTTESFLVSPGIRWAHDFESGLQIVPGIAFPLGVGPSAGERGVFVYLSFEHPFGRRAGTQR